MSVATQLPKPTCALCGDAAEYQVDFLDDGPKTPYCVECLRDLLGDDDE